MKKTRGQKPVKHQPSKLVPFEPIRLKKYNLFWICTCVLSILLIAIMAHDITSPFTELHSWGHAHDAWVARSHVVYGLGYTKGFDTFAVGNPPPEKPTRYLDHPVLFTLLNSAAMSILGVNEWSLRVMNIICTVIALLFFLKILRHLVDDITAILSGLFFCLFPLITFFGVNMWLYPLVLGSFWCYLITTGSLKDVTEKKWHKPLLAICIFLAIQMTWEGFFFAMAMGVHYLSRCIHKKKWPDWIIFLIFAIIPFASIALNFIILAAGHNWDFNRLFTLAKIRSTSGELRNLTWTIWFARFLEHGLTNFTLPVMVFALLGLTLGQIYAFNNKNSPRRYSLKFPQFWLLSMPALFQLTLLKGTLYPHQYWERPIALPLAVAVALTIMIAFDIIKKLNVYLSLVVSAALVIFICICCIYGIQYYYGIRWENPQRMQMFEYLNSKIPTDKALLSLEPYTIDQFPGIKAASYRPEVAWYLNREIVTAGANAIGINAQNQAVFNIQKAIADIEQKAQTQKFIYYLTPATYSYTDPRTGLKLQVMNMNQFLNELSRRYKIDSQYEYIPWVTKKVPWSGYVPWIYKMNPYAQQQTFYQRGMLPCIIFDLSKKPGQ
jgi:hypothetical protein